MIGGGRAALLRAYDEHLRGGAELLGATTVTRLGPLWLAVFPGGLTKVSTTTPYVWRRTEPLPP